LKHLAPFDSLEGAPNYTSYLQWLDRALHLEQGWAPPTFQKKTTEQHINITTEKALAFIIEK
jgi:hypothetical protein